MIIVRPVLPLRTRFVLLAFGALLAFTMRPAAFHVASGPTSIGVAHAEPAGPALVAARAPAIAAPRSIDWPIASTPALGGNRRIVSLYLRDCSLRL